MLAAVAVILGLAFIGWLIWWGVKKKPIKAHIVMYGLSCATGIFALAFFLSMDIPIIVKVLVCIVLGAVFIFLAAYMQRRKQPRRKKPSRS